MRHILEDIYQQLSVDDEYLTERDFSKDYLGRCGSYFAYLKSSDSQPSADVMLHLWGTLKQKKQVCEYQLPRARHPLNKHNLTNALSQYSSLAERAFQALNDLAIS